MKLSVITLLTFALVIGTAMSQDMKKQSFVKQKLSKFKGMVKGAVCSVMPNIAGTVASNLCGKVMFKIQKKIAIKTTGITDVEKYAPACFDAMIPYEFFEVVEECVTEYVGKKMETMKDSDESMGEEDSEESLFQAMDSCMIPQLCARLNVVYDKNDFNASFRNILSGVVEKNSELPDKVKARFLTAIQNDYCGIPAPGSPMLPTLRHGRCMANFCLMAMASQSFA